MKRIKSFLLVALATVIMLGQTGCIGSFQATKAIYKFNQSLGNKWLNEIVFLVFCVVPVYEIGAFVDVVVLNLIEFWTGSNPMAMAPGQIEIQKVTYQGKDYTMTATQNRMHIECTDASVKAADLVYTPQTSTWSMVQNGVTTDLMTYNTNGSITYYNADKTQSTFAAEYVQQMAGQNLALK
jgi:hypothetical protein